jgi:hypothetical protein
LTTELPVWLAHLDEEDYQFIKRFVLASGSLKELASEYGVSYPTIRARLDALIERVRALDVSPPRDAFDARVRVMVAEGELTSKLAKELMRVHNTVIKGGRK